MSDVSQANANETFPQLTAEYQRARNWTIVTAVALAAWRIFGVDLRIFFSVLQKTDLPDHVYLPHFVAGSMAYFVYRMHIEWCQSDERRRTRTVSKIDIGLTRLVALCSIGLSFGRLAHGTILEGVEFWTICGAIVLGYVFGQVMTFLIADVLAIRSKDVAEQTQARRIPIAVRCELFVMIPTAVVILGILWIAIARSPVLTSLIWVVLFLLTVPFVLVPFCMYELKSLVEALKKAADAHEHICHIAGWSERWRQRLPLPKKVTQAGVVRAITNARDIQKNRIGISCKLLHRCTVVWAKDETGLFLTLKPTNPLRRYIKLELIPKDQNIKETQKLRLPPGRVRINREELDRAGTREEMWKIIGKAINTAVSDYCDEQALESMRPHTPEEELVLAAEHNDIAKVKEMLNNGVSIEATGPGGWKPLIMASAQGHENIARFLLEKGADPNSSNHLGRTALHFAARYGNQKMLNLLIFYEAKVDVQDVEQNTPLILAARFGHNQAVTLLLNHGADPLKKNIDGRTAEQEARLSRHGGTSRIIRKRIRG